MLKLFFKVVLCLLTFVVSNGYAYHYDEFHNPLPEKKIQVENESFRYDGTSNFRVSSKTVLDDNLQNKAPNGSFFAFEVGLVATKEVDKFGNAISRTPKSIQDQMTLGGS